MRITRTLTRVFLKPEDLDGAVAFYERLFGSECEMRFSHPEAGLELAQVGSMLLLAGSPDALRPFEETRATFLVDSLEGFRGRMDGLGAVVLEEPKRVPTGRNARAKHPDGTVVEYVEHDV